MSVDLHTNNGVQSVVRFVLVLFLELAWWIISDPARLALWSGMGIIGLARSRSRHGASPTELAQTTTFMPFRLLARTAGNVSATIAFVAYWTLLLVAAFIAGTWLRFFVLVALVGGVFMLIAKRGVLRRTPTMLLGLRGMILHPGAWRRWRGHAEALNFDAGVLLNYDPATTVGERYVVSRRSDVADIDAEDLAAREHAEKARVARSRHRASLQIIDVIRRDPLKAEIPAPSIRSLAVDDDPLSTYAPIPWGLDEVADRVYVELVGEWHAHGMALASSRGGKTRWAWIVAAQHVARGGHLVVLDGKDGLSFNAFKQLARCRVVGADEGEELGEHPDQAILERGVAALMWAYDEQRRRNAVLRRVSEEHGTTYDTVRSALRDNVWPSNEPHPHAVLVMVDEAPWWTLSIDQPKLSKKIRNVLDTIASKGASAGVGLLLLTQRATIKDDTLPARARDNVKAIRVLFGTPPTPEAATSLFGSWGIAELAEALVHEDAGRAACTLAGSRVPVAARSWLASPAWLAEALGYAAERYGVRPASATHTPVVVDGVSGHAASAALAPRTIADGRDGPDTPSAGMGDASPLPEDVVRRSESAARRERRHRERERKLAANAATREPADPDESAT